MITADWNRWLDPDESDGGEEKKDPGMGDFDPS